MSKSPAALRGTKHGVEIPDSTSFWQPIRFAPQAQQLPATPKIQATASVLNGADPLFYDVADTEPGGSDEFAVLLEGVSEAEHAERFARELAAAVSLPTRIGDAESGRPQPGREAVASSPGPYGSPNAPE